MGSVTGSRARIPRTPSQWVLGPGRTPEQTSGRGWESARTRTPHTRAGGAPPGTLMPPPERAKPARKSPRCGVGGGSPSPHPPHPQPVGSGLWPHARKDEWSGLGERPTPDAPHPDWRRPPRAPSCRPQSAQSQLAKARAVGLVAGPHARTPRTHSQWVVGPGRKPQRTSVRGWESARPRAPRTQARGAPPERPRAAPTARQASAQGQLARARAVGVCHGSPRPHPPHWERAAASQVGGNGTGPPPPKQAKRSTGRRPDTRRGTERVERPYQRPAPRMREVRAPHQPTEGGGRARTLRERERTHTQRTRGENQKGNRTEPAESTDRMEWRTSERG